MTNKLLLLLSFIIPISLIYLLRPQPNVAFFASLASLPQVTSVYSGIGYISKDPQKYDIALLNSELSFPTQLAFTPDAKFLLVAQNTGELLAFRRSSPTEFFSAPNLVTTIDYPIDNITVEGSVIYLRANGSTYKLITSIQNNLLITTDTSNKFFASIPSTPESQIIPVLDFVSRSPQAQNFVSQPSSGIIDPITGHIFFVDTLEGRLYEIKSR